LKLEELGPVGPKKRKIENGKLKIGKAGLLKVGAEKRLFVFGRALALVGDDASDGGSDAGVASNATGLFADVEDFFLALPHGWEGIVAQTECVTR
jgi:hypothetical protein